MGIQRAFSGVFNKHRDYTIGLHDSFIAAFNVAANVPPYRPTVVYHCLLLMVKPSG
jgi:hypothetical protein